MDLAVAGRRLRRRRRAQAPRRGGARLVTPSPTRPGSPATSRRCARAAACPGIVEADDLGTYVCKFRGAGQGVRVLVAEVIVGELARRIGLRTPRLVALDLDPEIARYEADEEVQDLLNASPGSTSASTSCRAPSATTARADRGGHEARRRGRPRCCGSTRSCANVDRSWRNPNLLLWHGDLWVIDHGAALYFHHGWPGGVERPGPLRRSSRGTSATTCWRRTAAACAAVDRRSAPVLDAGRASTEVLAEVPGRAGSSRCPAPRRRTRSAAAYVELPHRAARHPAVAARGQGGAA